MLFLESALHGRTERAKAPRAERPPGALAGGCKRPGSFTRTRWWAVAYIAAIVSCGCLEQDLNTLRPVPGFCLKYSLPKAIEKEPENLRNRIARLRRALSLAHARRWHIATILLLTLFLAGLGAFEPLVLKYIFDGLDRSIQELIGAISEISFNVLPAVVCLGLAMIVMLRLEWQLTLAVLVFTPLPVLIAGRAAPETTREDPARSLGQDL